MSVPMHFCNHGGCSVMIPFNQTYCDKHYQPKRRYTSKYDEYEHRKAVGGKYFKFYNSKRWHRASQLYRYSHPTCENCAKQGIIRAGNVVDHIKPIRTAQGWTLRWNTDNFQTLCHACHNAKTREDEGRYHLTPLNNPAP